MKKQLVEKEPAKIRTPKKRHRKTHKIKRFFKKHKLKIRVIALVLLVLTTALFSLRRLNHAVSEAYHNAEEEYAQSTEDAFYTNAYERAEEYYHVSQDVAINIDSVRERANLQVYKVKETVDVTHDKDDNGITLWLELCGECSFTTDLQCAEFIVDQDRHYVLVRAPSPQITDFISLDYEKSKVLFYNDKWFNESFSTGVNLSNQYYQEGTELLEAACKNNPQYIRYAKEAAKRIITQIVKDLNPEIRDLTVDVEFM